ncbi:MAG TPA: hypothetical protein VE978_19090 [Chitinophagales bacterium]|nr:hypothetical protein [Chitinophagales bacterium]
MKLEVEYISNEKGKPRAVQLSLTNYQKLMTRLEKYEQMLKIKSDLTKAFQEVKLMQQGKIRKQTLSEFLSEL